MTDYRNADAPNTEPLRDASYRGNSKTGGGMGTSIVVIALVALVLLGLTMLFSAGPVETDLTAPQPSIETPAPAITPAPAPADGAIEGTTTQ